jgi:hypothetical protein
VEKAPTKSQAAPLSLSDVQHEQELISSLISRLWETIIYLLRLASLEGLATIIQEFCHFLIILSTLQV